MIKVSIIIPVYNVEQYLRQCLDSVVNQSLKDIEIICIDDGSPDNSGKILDEYAEHDSRIKVIHKENGGYGSALNCGFDMAKGEYIGIVESDDWIEHDMYERLYVKAIDTNADIVKGNYYYVDSKSMQKRRNKTFQKIIARTDEIFFREDPEILLVFASTWSCIYKKEWLKTNNIKVVEDIKPYEDQPFLAETFSKANKIVLEGRAEYYYRFANENSTTATTKPSILNYIIQKSRIRDIFIQNGCYSRKVMEFYWKGAYLGTMDWLNKPNNKYRHQFYNAMKVFYNKAWEDNCQFIYFNKNQKRTFLSVRNKSYWQYSFESFIKKIFHNIFSITNANDRKHKVINILGIKVQFKN